MAGATTAYKGRKSIVNTNDPGMAGEAGQCDQNMLDDGGKSRHTSDGILGPQAYFYHYSKHTPHSGSLSLTLISKLLSLERLKAQQGTG